MNWLPATALDSRDCMFLGCAKAAETGEDYCSAHLGEAPALSVVPPDPDDDLSDLDMENARRVLGRSGPSKPTKGARDPMNEYHAVIAAIRAFAREHGRPPTGTQLGYGNGTPTLHQIKKAGFKNLGDAVVAAGFPRPTRGGHRKPAGIAQPDRASERHSEDAGSKPAPRSEPVKTPGGGLVAGPFDPKALSEKAGRLSDLAEQLATARQEAADLEEQVRAAIDELREVTGA